MNVYVCARVYTCEYVYVYVYVYMERGLQLSGRMPNSQSSEPGFESLFATVSKSGHFRSLH